jgi:uncharacterized phage protein gp47/JayE
MPAETPFDSKDFATLTTDLLKSLAAAAVPLTDDSEGSVVRTLAEAFAHELAICYQQLQHVYRHAFLDTAEGVALDNVVTLLGMTRQRAGHVEGSVSFYRPQAAPADIPVPSGTQVTGRAAPVFETVEDAVLAKGEQEVSVGVRSLEPGGATVKAGALNLMPRPIWGMDGVTNHADLLLRQREETDAELRERARRLLQKATLGTPAAIEQAVRALGIAQVSVREDATRPGSVDVVLGDADIDDDLLKQVSAAVDDVRPAGIQVSVLRSERVIVEIAATLVLREAFTAQRQQVLGEQIRQTLQVCFDSLGTGERVRWSKISAILSAPDEVAELRPVAGTVYLRPFVASAGQWQDAAASHTLRNGDISIGANERAALDLSAKPLRLSLEPPVLEVWADFTLETVLDAGTEQALRISLQTQLDTFKPPRPITWNDLRTIMPPGRPVTAITLVHQHSGRVVILKPLADADHLAERECLLVGRIDSPGQNDG